MANRHTLHRNKLDLFRAWLVSRGVTLLEPKGTWEVLRWQGEPGRPMPIIYDRLRGDHLSANNEADSYVRAFVREKNGPGKPKQCPHGQGFKCPTCWPKPKPKPAPKGSVDDDPPWV